MVRRIREVLCFKAYCTSSWISGTVCSTNAVFEVACIQLQTWLCCIYLHCSSAVRFMESCCEAEFTFLFFVQYVVVVVSASVLQLFIVIVDSFSDSFRCAEIERSTLYESDFSCRNTLGVNRKIEVGVHLKFHIVHCRCWVGNTS